MADSTARRRGGGSGGAPQPSPSSYNSVNAPYGSKTHAHASAQQSLLSVKTAVAGFLLTISAFYAGVLVGSTTMAPACPTCPTCGVQYNAASGMQIPRRKAQEEHKLSMDSPTASFPKSMGKVAADFATVSRVDFMNTFDVGVPIDETTPMDDVLILYGHQDAVPDIKDHKNASASTAKCSSMKVILTTPAKKKKKELTNEAYMETPCIAVVPQWDSHHIHKFMRLPERPRWPLDMKYPLRYVSRSHQDKGTYSEVPDPTRHTTEYYNDLQDYLKELPRFLKELKPITEQMFASTPADVAATQDPKTIIVMVCNFGQAEVFANFVCTARARGLDLSRILMFATDEPTYKLAQNLGIAAYFDTKLFDDMPTQAARRYGDRVFTKVMMAKVYCVHLINALGIHLLFQDVDIVWYRHPLEFFRFNRPETKVADQHFDLKEWDLVFQDDGARSVRYAPLSPNSGFYYVKANTKTQFLFSSLARMGDVVYATSSHQAALTALLNEHMSWKGLRVKVFNRGETTPFPGGFEYHRRKDLMKKWLEPHRAKMNGTVPAAFGSDHPYIFHMSWTENKNNKKLFMQQMGEWHTHAQCLDGPEHVDQSTLTKCCLAQPDVICHYKDKASIIPCKDSPNLDNGRPSFW